MRGVRASLDSGICGGNHKERRESKRLRGRAGGRWPDTRSARALAWGGRLSGGRDRRRRRSGAGAGDRQCAGAADSRRAHMLAAARVCCADPDSLGALPARARRIGRGRAPAGGQKGAAKAVHSQRAPRRRARVDRAVITRGGAATAARYAFGAACIGVAMLLDMSPAGGLLHPRELLIVGVVAAGWFGDVGPGLLAAFLSAALIFD